MSTREKSGASHDLEVVLVLTTIGADADALTFARTLVEEHLAACVNVLPPMTSVYRWRGRIEEDQERQIVVKTTRQQVAALEQRLRQLHAYELPEFLVLATSGGSDTYLQWVGESSAPGDPPG